MVKEVQTDVVVVGGGTGGVAAAMAATSLGQRVVLTEETSWIGGQLTSQAVPPDEHRWIEQFGSTRRYRAYRTGVRAYYRHHHPLIADALRDPYLNPGQGGVSRLCHDFRIGHAVLEEMLSFARMSGLLRVMLNTVPVAAEVDGDAIRSVTVRNSVTNEEIVVAARYVLDATELGDLLPLAAVEYVSGAESQAETGEPHAVEGPPQPDNVQGITWCFPMAYDPAPGANHVIDRPPQYACWRNYVPDLTPAWTGPLLSWTHPDPITLRPRQRVLFPGEETRQSLWLYRRIVHSGHYVGDVVPHEVTLVNWPQNDYFEGNIIDKPEEERQRYLEEARQLSLSLMYWLQTEAPRPDGGAGYPGLYLRPDLVDTDDGLAKYPYIRESRRIRAVFTVTEQHVGARARGIGRGQPGEGEPFVDSVGVGCYRIDLHPSSTHVNYVDIDSLPFRIPLGALLPVRVRNLLPACKNLGVTHITTGCYRLHPVEWNIGEAAGLLAAHCLVARHSPHAVRESQEYLQDFQRLCAAQGFELSWPRTTAV
ncbi:MAG: FAD-dependent oxidoreductase [Chloroflexi bacterium]|nr:FAD-dependent oxidoreductase [Chloroflexota bacterium]